MKRHEPDWTSLIAGVTFCAIALAYLGGEVTHRSLELRWVVPMLLVGLGLAGLAGTLVRAHRMSDTAATPVAATPTVVTPMDSADQSDDGPHPSSP
ncbi:MAG TPA: hypothetical protein VGL75_15940 [Acidothermaceae bacterium]|jgi:hypothetical protein